MRMQVQVQVRVRVVNMLTVVDEFGIGLMSGQEESTENRVK